MLRVFFQGGKLWENKEKLELEEMSFCCNTERQVPVYFALSENLRDSQVLKGIGTRSISNAKDVNNGNVLVELSQRLQCTNIQSEQYSLSYF